MNSQTTTPSRPASAGASRPASAPSSTASTDKRALQQHFDKCVEAAWAKLDVTPDCLMHWLAAEAALAGTRNSTNLNRRLSRITGPAHSSLLPAERNLTRSRKAKDNLRAAEAAAKRAMTQPAAASLVAAIAYVAAMLRVYPHIDTSQSTALRSQNAYKWVQKHCDREIRKQIERLTPRRPAPPAPIKKGGTL